MVTAKYLLEHFKSTTTSDNKWLYVVVKPVSTRMWNKFKKYGEPLGWKFFINEEHHTQYFTIPFSEAELEHFKETGSPEVAYFQQ